MLPFIVRAQWGYTRWSLIRFSFLASASPQVEAGYYQIDTGSLSSCFSGKKMGAFIPFKNSNNHHTSALTFLHGFEISSISVNGSYNTPFEVQIIQSECTTHGISLILSSTSATQIHSLLVSYVLYDPSIINMVAGSYMYDDYSPMASLMHTPPIGVSNNNVAFHGFGGFIVANSNNAFGISGNLNNGNVSLTTPSSYYYACYSYFFLIGGPCGQCEGYHIYHDDQCVASCPPSSYYNGKECIICNDQQVWDGEKCVPKPVIVVDPVPPTTPSGTGSTSGTSSGGSGTSTTTHTISCPVGTHWDSQKLRCEPCPAGCSSCKDCYSCEVCSSGFTLNAEKMCDEVCGDGMRFVLACDDGNNRNGDGCSSSCQIEDGFFCSGGSPNNRDTCSNQIPKAISFVSSGQSHYYGKIFLNVRANYLPLSLLNSPACKHECGSILKVDIVSGDKSTVGIKAKYIKGTSFSFAIEVDFGREPIGLFSVRVGINPVYANYYFKGLDTSSTLNVNVNPAFLALQGAGQGSDILS